MSICIKYKQTFVHAVNTAIRLFYITHTGNKHAINLHFTRISMELWIHAAMMLLYS